MVHFVLPIMTGVTEKVGGFGACLTGVAAAVTTGSPDGVVTGAGSVELT